MIYLEHRPIFPLGQYVDRLWYCRAPGLPHARERVLPSGRMQIVFNLAADTFLECDESRPEEVSVTAPALLAGPRVRYELVDTRDFTEVMGILFRPGGAAPLFREHAGTFFEQFVPLGDMFSGLSVRDCLLEASSPLQKLERLEQWLLARMHGNTAGRQTLVVEALKLLSRRSVRESAAALSVSERRLHQIFQAEVGLSPKQWARTTRFQRAVHLLHAGRDLRWEQLALDCGYYDQPHFCREFKAFSGIDPSTYVASVGQWANHVRVE